MYETGDCTYPVQIRSFQSTLLSPPLMVKEDFLILLPIAFLPVKVHRRGCVCDGEAGRRGVQEMSLWVAYKVRDRKKRLYFLRCMKKA